MKGRKKIVDRCMQADPPYEVLRTTNRSSEDLTRRLGQRPDEFQQNSIFWESLGAIWIDSVSFEAFRSVSNFFIFSILEFWLGRAHRRGFLA